MQHFLKSASGAADAEVVAAELLLQFDIAMDDANAALHAGFGREGFPTLARDLKRTAGRRGCAWSWSWHPPSGCGPRRRNAKAVHGQGGRQRTMTALSFSRMGEGGAERRMRVCRFRRRRGGAVAPTGSAAGPHPCPSPIRERGSPRVSSNREPHSLKVVIPVGAVETAARHAAFLEICARSRRRRDRCGRAFPAIRHRHGRCGRRASRGFRTGRISDACS